MGGEGSMMSANNSLKQNRALLKKLMERKQQNLYFSHEERPPAKFKVLSPEEWKKYRAAQQAQFDIEKRHNQSVNLIIFVSIFLVLAVILYVFVFS